MGYQLWQVVIVDKPLVSFSLLFICRDLFLLSEETWNLAERLNAVFSYTWMCPRVLIHSHPLQFTQLALTKCEIKLTWGRWFTPPPFFCMQYHPKKDHYLLFLMTEQRSAIITQPCSVILESHLKQPDRYHTSLIVHHYVQQAMLLKYTTIFHPCYVRVYTRGCQPFHSRYDL